MIPGALFVANLVFKEYPVRIDLTEDKLYTVSEPTREILAGLEEPVGIETQFSQRSWFDSKQYVRQVKSLLESFERRSREHLEVIYKDPCREESSEQNIQDRLILRSGKRQEIVPLAGLSHGPEYKISRAILAVSTRNKTLLGIIREGGSAGIRSLEAALFPLEKYYDIREIDLHGSVPEELNLLLFIRPRSAVEPARLQYLEQFLERGGGIFLAADRVRMDLQSQSGTEVRTGIAPWLEKRGILIKTNFVVDKQCGSIAIQKQSGFFRFTSNVSFPYLLRAVNFGDHPITDGLKQIAFSFVSEVRPAGKSGVSFVPLILSSGKSNVREVPLIVDLEKSWSDEDWVGEQFPMAAAVTLAPVGRMVVVGEGDFLVKTFPQVPEPLPGDHILFLSQSLEWLSDPNGLITIKSKEIATPRIDPMNASLKVFLAWLNVFLPVIFVLVLAWSWNRHRRIQAYRRKIK